MANHFRIEMDSYGDMNRVLITDDVDSQCVDMLIANGFAVEKDIKLAKQQEQLIQKMQVDKSLRRKKKQNSCFIFIRFSRKLIF